MPELIWDGKYDKDGRRAAPLRVALPFQTVETVNETAQQRQLSIDRYLGGRDAEWRNRLIWGDNKNVLPSHLQEFAGRVDHSYIDGIVAVRLAPCCGRALRGELARDAAGRKTSRRPADESKTR